MNVYQTYPVTRPTIKPASNAGKYNSRLTIHGAAKALDAGITIPVGKKAAVTKNNICRRPPVKQHFIFDLPLSTKRVILTHS